MRSKHIVYLIFAAGWIAALFSPLTYTSTAWEREPALCVSECILNVCKGVGR